MNLKENTRSDNTKERVLESACRIFAEKGFRDATAQKICRNAKANIASMNYYFRNKANLYHEVWQHTKIMDDNAHGSGNNHDANPENWLRSYVQQRVEAVFDDGPAGYFCRIIRREMADPTPMTAGLYSEFLLPGRKKIEDSIRKILGPAATSLQITNCALNILSLYVFLNIRRMAGDNFAGNKKLTGSDAKAIALQTAEFAIAGLHGIRHKINGLNQK